MTLSEYINTKVDEMLNEMAESVPESNKENIEQIKVVLGLIGIEASKWTIEFLQESLNERRTNSSTEKTKVDESN